MLMGAKIVHRTDHRALEFLRSCKLLSDRLLRWTLAIQDYDLQVEFCPGKENVVADALSQQTFPEIGTPESGNKNILLCPLARRPSLTLAKALANMNKEQEKDRRIERVIRDLQITNNDVSRYKY